MNSKVSFSAASRDYQMGRYTQSLATLNQLMDIQQDGKTYALLAKNLVQLGFKADAAKAYGLAAGCEGPNSYEYAKQAAKLHYETGNEDEALLIAMRNLTKAQEDAELAFIITAIYLKRQQRDIIRPFKTVLSQSSNPDHLRLAAMLLTQPTRTCRATSSSVFPEIWQSVSSISSSPANSMISKRPPNIRQ